MSNSNSSGGGMGFVGWLTIVFIALKLMGFITWSWWWVWSPMWITALGVITFLLVCVALKVWADS